MKKAKLFATFTVLFLILSAQLLSAQTYDQSKPVKLFSVSNLTISGKIFDANNENEILIYLNNCHDIHITNCKFINSKNIAVELKNGCYNITIDHCYFSDVCSGIYAQDCANNLVVNSNKFLNMIGPFPQGHAVQFNNVNGAGNIIENNMCETIFGTGDNPNPGTGDILNLYKSNGTPSSPIRIAGNSIKGGGTNRGSEGAAGIVAGDVGGSWQIVENNILVNSGAAGIIIQGGTHIIIQHNKIFGENLPWSAAGIGCANYSGKPSNKNKITDNDINWYSGQQGRQRDTSYKPEGANDMPEGWINNKVRSTTVSSGMLPKVLIQKQ